jgi:hypothetical protein
LKKEAKTFAYWGARWIQRARQRTKVFWFFFSKKNCLPSRDSAVSDFGFGFQELAKG